MPDSGGKQKNCDVAVLSTVYPAMLPYFDDFLDSLEMQEFREFDLLLANDGLEGMSSGIGARSLEWFEVPVADSVSSNRRRLIHAALEMGYTKIIFADSDDQFEPNRIGLLSELLGKAPVVVNDLDVCDENGRIVRGRFFKQRFGESFSINASAMQSGNIMGLSNTAVRADVIAKSPALSGGESTAFDWFLWTSILLTGVDAQFTSDTSTKYRNYGANTAGLPQAIDEASVIRGVEIKRQHYMLMRELDGSYAALADEFQWAKAQLKNSAWLEKFVSVLRVHAIKNNMWWENVRAPSEVGLR